MAMTQQTSVRALAGACTLAALAACGGGGGGSSGETQTAGTLGVSLTDAPACGFDKVFVTVTKVRVHRSASAGADDNGWTEIAVDPARSRIDLLSLSNGVLQPLGQTPLAAGHYSQLRLVLNKNSGNGLANAVLPTGQSNEVALITPSAVESGLKLENMNEGFDIEAGQRADLVLDFDACKSIVSRGNGDYALKPVVKVIPTLLNGVEGYVAAGLTDVHVSAQKNGEIISSTAPDSEGHFYLSRLPVGAYDVVITASDRATTIVGAVPVTSPTATTTLGTRAAPISLLAAPEARKISGTVSFTPPSTDAAYVYASQALPSGSTITIKYKASDASGNYTLSDLPKVAPQYAPYNATALVFSSQAGIKPGVGQYAVQASASGYQTTASKTVDIGLGNQVGINFTLTR